MDLTISEQRQAYRALQQRKDDLEKLGKKANDLGVPTNEIDEALLQTRAAIENIVGQGDLFPPTPIEREAQDAEEETDPLMIEAGYEIVEEPAHAVDEG